MSNKDKAKEEIKLLVAKYNRLVEAGKVKSYNEEMTKKDFILPLFRALSWSVEDGEEVTAEEKISKGRVDYAFRIQSIPKLFLEAKSLKEDLDKIEFAEQAINYAWHKGATWAVLTDFEGIKVFNAEWKSSNPLQNLFFSLSCNQFLERFEQLWLLSRGSLENSAIDKEAEKWGKKAKKVPVDKQLLSDLTRFRELLTKNILKNNVSKNLSAEELDEAIQRIIDRLIFIRTIEDKQLEAPILQSLIREDQTKRVYKKLNNAFRKIDDIYNSKLFAFHLCEELNIDDDVLEKIITGLFKTSDETVHYDFSAIDADVLGNIYEQYLGYLLKKTEKRGKLVEGKAHRKEQGIYYTPTYVVDYIVKNTIGELAKDKKIDLSKIKVLDPACGSGSFLMKAFDYLVTLDKKRNGVVEQTKLDTSGASATYGRKIEILKNNIFGVDLDPKAVEIAQLNLLLKAAEKKHRLPTLQENIKVGNSLIDDSAVSSRAFKWEEQFKEIIANGGFDVVVGNPPWGADIDDILDYLKEKYPNSTQEHKDIYKCFIEQAMNLLRNEGLLGFIVPNTCLLQPRYKDIRLFLKGYTIIKIANLGEKVFEGVDAPSCIIIVQKKMMNGKNKIKIIDLANSKDNSFKANALSSPKYIELLQSVYDKTVDNNFVTFYRELKNDEKFFGEVIDCRDAGINYQRVGTGMKEKGKGDLAERLLYKNNEQKRKIDVMYYKGEDINRYSIQEKTSRFVRTDYKNFIKKNEVVRLDTKTYSHVPKLLWRQTAEYPIAVIDNAGVWFGRSIQAGIFIDKEFDIRYLLALLNSKYFSYLYIQSARELGRVFPQVKLNKIKQLPIKIIPLEKQQPFIKLVDRMLSLNKQLQEIGDKKTAQTAKLDDEIKKTDQEIDELVYKLYGITEAEKKIIEESLR